MNDFFKGKKVFLTGHTGFKGGWLSIWLKRLGADVIGYSLEPPTKPSLFEVCGLEKVVKTVKGNVTNLDDLSAALDDARPDIVFHLAAQALVRPSYKKPVETLNTNILGTVNLLEAARNTRSVRAVIVVTTDKCYENKGLGHPYRETEALGGHDPYSASKACAEIVTASYRSSFLSGAKVAVASARAGNVIGGGDWAEDRLLPDCIRAFTEKRRVELRYPHAIRPWQHVLEPLYGYILLAEKLLGADAAAFSDSWNFGPDAAGDATVGEIARKAADCWGSGAIVSQGKSDNLHEAGILRLDITKARTNLKWRPRWPIDRAVEETISWYKAWHGKTDNMHQFSLKQIESYEESV